MVKSKAVKEWEGEVKKQMKLRDMTGRDLAKASGWSESAVRKCISGHYHNDNPRVPIERALGIEGLWDKVSRL